jgi:hypothetical protein
VDNRIFNWPAGFEPENVPLYVRNERTITGSPQAVWEWLIYAPTWPTWYPNSRNVKIKTGDGRSLRADSQFTWTVQGLPMLSRIHEYEPEKRIGWIAESPLLYACHSWDIQPTTGGCHVVTDETQKGLLPSLFGFILRPMMLKAHDLWLARLDQQAQKGPPPP